MNAWLRTLSLIVVGSSAACAGGEGTSEESVGVTKGALSVNVCPADVPPALAPPLGQTVKASLAGVGVQIYMCTEKSDGSFGWMFVAPQANLFNDEGKLVGTHFIGPTWQGNDASSVVGQKLAGSTVDPTAIPWLLLNGASHGTQPGRFSDVTSIQRLSTVGGIAPTDGCDTNSIGAVAQVPYTATYVFYKAATCTTVTRCGG
jgi:hypothetical protein